MKTVIEMALDAGVAFDSEEYPEIWQTYMNVGRKEIERFAELVRADERIRTHTLGPGAMELILRRNHKDDLFECRRHFSAEEVMHGSDCLVEKVAKQLVAEMDNAIRTRINT